MNFPENFLDHITIINNQDNLGLGKALNQGMIEAFRLGFKMCATFDQDSKILPNYRDEMLKHIFILKIQMILES